MMAHVEISPPAPSRPKREMSSRMFLICGSTELGRPAFLTPELLHTHALYGEITYTCISHRGHDGEDDAQEHVWNDQDFILGRFVPGVMHDIADPAVVTLRRETRAAVRNLLMPATLLPPWKHMYWMDSFCCPYFKDSTEKAILFRSCTRCLALVDCRPESITRAQGAIDLLSPISLADRDVRDVLLRLHRHSSQNQPEQQQVSWQRILHIFFGHVVDNETIEALEDILECEWFQKLKTLEEAVMPTKVLLIPESTGSTEHSITYNQLMQILKGIEHINDKISLLKISQPEVARGPDSWELVDVVDETPMTYSFDDLDWDALDQIRGAIVAKAQGWLLDREALKMSEPQHSVPDASVNFEDFLERRSFIIFRLKALAKSFRKAHDPRDYVHQVVGLLQVEGITWIENQTFEDVWHGMEKKLYEFGIEFRKGLYLKDASNLGDFYGRMCKAIVYDAL